MLSALLHVADHLKRKKPVTLKRSAEEAAKLETRGSYAAYPKQKNPNAKKNNKWGPRKD